MVVPAAVLQLPGKDVAEDRAAPVDGCRISVGLVNATTLSVVPVATRTNLQLVDLVEVASCLQLDPGGLVPALDHFVPSTGF